jgi:hypothetical protein
MICSVYLWLEVSVDVPEFVQLVNSSEHFADIESGMCFLQDAGIVQERPEIPSWDIFHSQVDKLTILESVEQPHKPWCFSCC